MSRRKLVIPDCLEMLLDTICNTFGAVIFISMLLSMFVGEKTAGNSARNVTQEVEEIIALQQHDIAVARLRQASLKSQMEQQEAILSTLSHPESQRLASEIDQLSRLSASMLDQKTKQVETLTETEAESLSMEAEILTRRQERQQLQKETAALRSEFEDAIRKAGRTARVSRVRSTDKFGFAYMLHDRRLYQVITPSGSINDDHCREIDRDGLTCVLPKPDGGIVLPAEKSVLGRVFDGIQPDRQFVRLFVSPNSFAEFTTIKDSLIDMGLEYEVIVFEDNKAELFMSSEKIDSFVQ